MSKYTEHNLCQIKKEMEEYLNVEFSEKTMELLLARCEKIKSEMERGSKLCIKLSEAMQQVKETRDFKSLAAVKDVLEQLKERDFLKGTSMANDVEEFLRFLERDVCIFDIAKNINEELAKRLGQEQNINSRFFRPEEKEKQDERKGAEVFVDFILNVLVASDPFMTPESIKAVDAVINIFLNLDFSASDFEGEVKEKICQHWRNDGNWEKVGKLPPKLEQFMQTLIEPPPKTPTIGLVITNGGAGS